MGTNKHPNKNSVPLETFLIVFYAVFLTIVLLLVGKSDRVSFVQVLASAVLTVIGPFAYIVRGGRKGKNKKGQSQE